MAARKVRKGGREPSPASPAAPYHFTCEGCDRPLELEAVRRADAERVDGAINGYVLFDHECPCSPGVRTTRTWGSFPAFLTLFGRMPRLPYRSPFRSTPVADDAPSVLRWRWELDQVVDAEELLLYIDDARGREAGAA